MTARRTVTVPNEPQFEELGTPEFDAALFDCDYFGLGPGVPTRPPIRGMAMPVPGRENPFLENLPCEKHSWKGGHYGCRDCINEACEAAHAKKLQSWERFRDLADLLKAALLVEMSSGHFPLQPEACAQSAMNHAKAALALLDAEQPEAGPVPARTEG